jgi:hypothetical protein
MNETFNHYLRLRKISHVHRRRNLRSPPKQVTFSEEFTSPMSDSVKGKRCVMFNPFARNYLERIERDNSSLELVQRLVHMKLPDE